MLSSLQSQARANSYALLRKGNESMDRCVVESLERRCLLAANQLVSTTQPESANAGSPIDSPAGVQVTIENAAGQRVTTATDTINISIGSNPGSATIGGTLSAAAINGVANFTNLLIGVAGNNYTLIAADATNPPVTTATSSAFNIEAIPLFNSLRSLTYGDQGYASVSTLVAASTGNLFGTNPSGGLYGYGTVFELPAANPSTPITLFSFSGVSGNYPGSAPKTGLAIDSSGNLFGTTSTGGGANDGTVFELAANLSSFTNLFSFTGTSGLFPGQSPLAGLTLDAAGNIFGTASRGGASNDGTIFELGADHSTFKSLISFTGSTGNYLGTMPRAALTIDGGGNIYGSTYAGGTSVNGTVFELSADHSTFKSLVSFNGSSGTVVGSHPQGVLTLDSGGNLIGTTASGGTLNNGEIFKIATDHTFKLLCSFTGNSGNYLGSVPLAGFVTDSNGNFFGTASAGGAGGYGTVFELSSDETTFTSLLSFTGSSGAAAGTAPSANLTIDSQGNLYGTTAFGCSYYGTAFTIPGPSHSSLITLANFAPSGGVTPIYGSLPETAAEISMEQRSSVAHSGMALCLSFPARITQPIQRWSLSADFTVITQVHIPAVILR